MVTKPRTLPLERRTDALLGSEEPGALLFVLGRITLPLLEGLTGSMVAPLEAMRCVYYVPAVHVFAAVHTHVPLALHTEDKVHIFLSVLLCVSRICASGRGWWRVARHLRRCGVTCWGVVHGHGAGVHSIGAEKAVHV